MSHMTEPPCRGSRLLAKALQRRGLTQGAAERLCGLGDGTVCRYLAGTRRPDLAAALAIERELAVPVASWVQ
jgi:transcriptional regulator with XRE-family HTH domain